MGNRINLGRLLAVVCCLAMGTPPTTVLADSDSIITASVGSNLGVSSVRQRGASPELSFANNINLRLRALYVLGLELAYAPTDSYDGTPGRDLVFQNSLKMSALLYLIPTPYVAAYGKAGIEGSHLGALVSVTDPSNAYHLGGGLDISLTDHLTISAELLMLIPGFVSVQSAVQTYVVERRRTVEAALSRGETPPTAPSNDAPGPDDFLNVSNYRATVGLHWWF